MEKREPTYLANQYAELGIELLRQHQYQDAVDAFELVLSKTPDDVPALCNLGIVLMRLERWSKAEEVTRRYLDQSPEDIAACVRLGIIRRKIGMMDGSIEVLKRAVDLDPGMAVAHKELGASYLKAEQFDDAAHAFQQAIDLKRSYVDAWCGLAKSHEMQQKPGQALRIFLDSLQHIPSERRGPIYARLGRMYRKVGQWKHAKVALEKAIAKGEKDPRLAFELGYVQNKLGSTPEGIRQADPIDRLASDLQGRLRDKGRPPDDMPLGAATCGLEALHERPVMPSRKPEPPKSGMMGKLKNLFHNVVDQSEKTIADVTKRMRKASDTDTSGIFNEMGEAQPALNMRDELGDVLDDSSGGAEGHGSEDGEVLPWGVPVEEIAKKKMVELAKAGVRAAKTGSAEPKVPSKSSGKLI